MVCVGASGPGRGEDKGKNTSKRSSVDVTLITDFFSWPDFGDRDASVRIFRRDCYCRDLTDYLPSSTHSIDISAFTGQNSMLHIFRRDCYHRSMAYGRVSGAFACCVCVTQHLQHDCAAV